MKKTKEKSRVMKRSLVAFSSVLTVMSTCNLDVALADNDDEFVNTKKFQIGVAGIEDYSYTKNMFYKSDGHRLGDLPQADDISKELYYHVSLFPVATLDLGYSWNTGYYERDDDVKKSHFTSNASNNVDDVDMFFYVGHGFNSYTSQLYTRNENIKYASLPISSNQGNMNDNLIKRRDMRFGKKDMEWAITFTCNFLSGLPTGEDGFGQVGAGVHSICGYATQQRIVNYAASCFLDYATYLSVKDAWFAYSNDTNKYNTAGEECVDTYSHLRHVARVFTTIDTQNDHIYGFGSQTRKDPKPYLSDSSRYVTYTKYIK